jgi:hypothetical protein
MKLHVHRGRRAAPRRRGFTALELTLATAALLLTAGMTVTAIDKMQRTAHQTATAMGVQEDAERALEQVCDRLARSGFVTSGGFDYPHLFVDGVPGVGFTAHAHAAPESFVIVVNGAPQASWSREIVFLRPLDADAPGTAGHGTPDLDANGALMWDTDECSLVVLPSGDGRNELWFCVDTAPTELLASNVESLICTDTALAGAAVPTNSIQVELTLRGLDDQGRLARYTARALVRMRNG